MRALFLAGYEPEAAAAMRGWLASGNEIAAVWNPQMKRSGTRHRDARFALLAPRWSTISVSSRAGAKRSIVPRLATWQGCLEAVAATGADVLISAYFPFRVPQEMIDAFGGRAVNFHPAPLPLYRGPVPFHAMIADHTIERDGAMTLHVMTAGLDEGAIVGREPIAFPADRSLVRYRLRAARAADKLARTMLPDFLDGKIRPTPQDEAIATYFRIQDLKLTISSGLDAEEIRWRCDTLAPQTPVPVNGIPAMVVIGFDRILGPPTGEPPTIHRASIDLDCSDARVRLGRKTPWSAPLRKLRTIAIHMSEPA